MPKASAANRRRTKGEAKPPTARPHMEALLFCDYASTAVDGKTTLAGVFNVLRLRPDQEISPRFYVYVRVGDVTESGLQLRTLDPAGAEVASGHITPAPGQDTVKFPSHMEGIIPLRVRLPSRGVYRFEVMSEGETLGWTALSVEERAAEDDEEDSDDTGGD